MESYKEFTFLGFMLIIGGIILISLPIIIRNMPDLDRLPWILIWTYEKNGFYFATSPILIIMYVITLLLNFYNRIS